MIWPTPRQRGQVCETWKNPRALITWPRPLQVGQLIVREPGAAAVALRAGVELAHFDFFFDAEGCFFERDLHVVAQIGAALATFAIDLRATAEERLENTAAHSAAAATRAENFAEDIEWIMES